MSAEIIPFRKPSEADLAWREYAALARAMQDNPSLALNRAHVEKTILAHDRFSRAFLKGDAQP